MSKEGKNEIRKSIEEFFKDIKNASSESLRKIRREAMSINYKLGKNKRLFCKRCNKIYDNKDIIRIKKGIKRITCNNCKTLKRWKIK